MISHSTKLKPKLTHQILLQSSLAQFKSSSHEIPKQLYHKDWLSQTQVLHVFSSIQNPNSLLPSLHHYSTRKDFKPSEPLFALVISRLAHARLFDAAHSLMLLLKSAKPCRLSDEFFRGVIKDYANVGGHLKRAIQTLYDMPECFNCWPSTKTFNLVLHALVSAKMFHAISEVYLMAPKLGVEIDCCSLNIILKGMCESGNVKNALKMLDEFPKQKCAPNALTYATLMHGLCVNVRVDEAFALLRRMEDEGVDPDSVTFNILIAGLRRQKRFDEGIEVFERMKLKGCAPNASTYHEVLYCLLDAQRFVEAKEFMVRMFSKRVGPSFVSYKKLVEGFCKEKRVEELDWVLRQMMGQGFVPKMGIWRQIVRALLPEKSSNQRYVSYGKAIDDLIF